MNEETYYNPITLIRDMADLLAVYPQAKLRVCVPIAGDSIFLPMETVSIDGGTITLTTTDSGLQSTDDPEEKLANQICNDHRDIPGFTLHMATEIARRRLTL